MSTSVGEDFPKEQERVRQLLVEYEKLGPVGMFGAMMIKAALANAEKAAISGDIVQILRAYRELKECN